MVFHATTEACNPPGKGLEGAGFELPFKVIDLTEQAVRLFLRHGTAQHPPGLGREGSHRSGEDDVVLGR